MLTSLVSSSVRGKLTFGTLLMGCGGLIGTVWLIFDWPHFSPSFESGRLRATVSLLTFVIAPSCLLTMGGFWSVARGVLEHRDDLEL